MPIWRGRTYVSSEITIDGDLDMKGEYQVEDLDAPTTSQALRKGKKDVTNNEISDTANIALTKLAITLGIINAHIKGDAGIAYSKLDLAGLIRNTDIKADANIAVSKLNSAVCTEAEALALVTYESLDTNTDIGTGAAQVARGNHTHTLVEDLLANANSGTETITSSGGYQKSAVVGGTTEAYVATTTPDFNALSMAVAVAVAHFSANYGDFKLRLYMGGVLEAESDVIALESYAFTILVHTKALSGEQEIKACLYNSGGGNAGFYHEGHLDDQVVANPIMVAVGSVKP